MTDEQKIKFNLLNAAWSLLEPHVTDKETYRTIMGDMFKLCFKKIPDRFSDSWWNKTVTMFFKYSDSYKGTEYEDFAGELAIGMCDSYEHESKLNRFSQVIFYKCVERAFINEWERKERISGQVLPEPQGTEKTELQRTDSVPEVGGSKEGNMEIEASDWG